MKIILYLYDMLHLSFLNYNVSNEALETLVLNEAELMHMPTTITGIFPQDHVRTEKLDGKQTEDMPKPVAFMPFGMPVMPFRCLFLKSERFRYK